MLNLKNKSHAVTAEIVIPDSGAQGVLINEGGITGGWVLYLTPDGRLTYHYNFLGMQRASISSAAPVPAGARQVRMEFTYDGGGLGKGGQVVIGINGKEAGRARINNTVAGRFGIDTFGVGSDTGGAAGLAQQHQGEQPGGFRFVGHQLDEGPPEPDGFIRQVGSGQGLS